MFVCVTGDRRVFGSKGKFENVLDCQYRLSVSHHQRQRALCVLSAIHWVTTSKTVRKEFEFVAFILGVAMRNDKIGTFCRHKYKKVERGLHTMAKLYN